MSRRQNLDACRSTPGFEEARQLLAEAWIRMDRPQPNAHGGAFQAGGVYWRLANVLKWLESKLPTLEGPKHAAFVIATNGRLVTGTSATTPADEIALEPRGAQMKDHIPLPAPDYTEDVQGFVHDTQRHYYAEETMRAYAERLHAARVKTLPAQLMAGLQAEVDALRHQLQTLAELGDASGDTQILRMGYAAARLEIESLNTQLQAAREEIKRRDAQEAAIGAGGVEPLRRRECLHQIAEPDGPLEMPPVTPEQFSMDIAELMGAPAAQGDAEDDLIARLTAEAHENKVRARAFEADAARWRWLSEHIMVGWNDGKFTSLVRVVSDENRASLNASVDRMMACDWSDVDAVRSQAKEGGA